MFLRFQKKRVYDCSMPFTPLDASPKLIARIVGYALGEESISSHLEWRCRWEPPTLNPNISRTV